MAPEVRAGQRYTASADVYSFGVAMLELYAGKEYTGDINAGVPQRVRRHLPQYFELFGPCAGDDVRQRPDMREIVLKIQDMDNVKL